jgi:hypothetical protein
LVYVEVEDILDGDGVASGMFETFYVGGEVEDAFEECGEEVELGVFGEEELFLGGFVTY